jgi:hypothetical protein
MTLNRYALYGTNGVTDSTEESQLQVDGYSSFVWAYELRLLEAGEDKIPI